MRVVSPSFEILSPVNEAGGFDTTGILELIELAGRTCYKSERRIGSGSAESFVRSIIKRGHESVIEHASVTVRFIVDRGVSHELVRHRIASYSQESTRYCSYKDEVTFVLPPFLGSRESRLAWEYAMISAEGYYKTMLSKGAKPEEARAVLPNSLKTEIVMTTNLREWRHVLKLRTSKRAHPQMREVMVPLLAKLKAELPAVFEDL